jgi:hypothetical protein
MARAKLSAEERASNDRASWARSRARTGNWSSRAYNLAIQDAARIFREEQPERWEQIYAVRSKEQRERVEGGEACTHDTLVEVEQEVVALQCSDCHIFIGAHPRGTPVDGYQVFTGDGGRVAYQRIEGE